MPYKMHVIVVLIISTRKSNSEIDGFLNEFTITSELTKNWIISLLGIVKPKRGTWSETILQVRIFCRAFLGICPCYGNVLRL